jgi:signal transduction histidine kinase
MVIEHINYLSTMAAQGSRYMGVARSSLVKTIVHSLRRAYSPVTLVLLLLGPLSALAHGEATRHVLVVSSSERPFAPQSDFADALERDLIRSSREPIQFVDVSVEAARGSDEEPDLSTVQRIRSASGADPFDLVITIGGIAASFVQQYREQLFPATPTLIAGVDRRFVEHATFTDNETTVATQHDPALMIDEILRLLPETRSVMVIIGTSQVEQFWLQQMKREFRRFGDRLQFSWTNELSFDAIKERSRTMPPRSAIFFAVLSVDGKGEPQVDGDTLKSLHAVANAPLFGLYGMGDGIVGGPLLSTSELSRMTAQVALRVLAGEPPSRIKTPVQRTGSPIYDARELRRWDIDERRLPSASVVVFRESPIWKRNRAAIAFGALLGGIPTVAILLVVAVKHRRADKRPFGANSAGVPLPADAAVSMWTVSPDGKRAEAGRSSVAQHGSWTALMHPEDVERCDEIFHRALERHEPFQLEYRTLEADGAERWMLDTGMVRFSGEIFDGYVGSTIDITRLGRTRAELSNLSRSLIQEHEGERVSLAKTLHDVSERMAMLTLRLHSFPAAAHDGEVTAIRETLSRLVAEIAAVPDAVHDRLQLLGLATVSRRFCENLSARHELAIHFRDADVPRDLPSDVALALFRVLQEAVVNAVVHANTHEVWVSMSGAAGEVRLQIVDCGVGFDMVRTLPSVGVGLVAIRERLKLVNGDSRIVSAPGEGTLVEAWVPLLPSGRQPL